MERDKQFGSKEEDSTSQSDSESTGKTQSDHFSNTSHRRSDFWASRGNIGEKINLLIGLNLSIINLLSTLLDIQRQNGNLPPKIVSDFEIIKDYFSNMLTQPDSGQELKLLEKIESIDIKLSNMLKKLSESAIEGEIQEKASDLAIQDNIVGVFIKKQKDSDKWGVVESIKSILSSYSNLSHLGFPSYYFVACEEIIQYQLQKEFLRPKHYEIIQIPLLRLKALISKLLREAPSARLLQNLRRIFPADQTDLTSSEYNQIQDIVEQYYIQISEFLNDERTLQDSLRSSSTILREYNLGGGDLESRIPMVSYTVIKNIQKELDQLRDNDFKQYILSESIILINKLNNSILGNERFIILLRRLK